MPSGVTFLRDQVLNRISQLRDEMVAGTKFCRIKDKKNQMSTSGRVGEENTLLYKGGDVRLDNSPYSNQLKRYLRQPPRMCKTRCQSCHLQSKEKKLAGLEMIICNGARGGYFGKWRNVGHGVAISS